MTVIASVIHQSTVYMGSDTLMTSGFDTSILAPTVPKLFHRGPFLIGVTGSVRALHLVRYRLSPEPQTGVDDMEYIAMTLVDELRRVLKDGGVAEEKNGIDYTGDDDHYSRFLVGYRGHVYRIGSDYNVTEVESDFVAIGSGEDFALGALHATPHLSPIERITIAVEAAIRFNATVGGRVRIESQSSSEAMELTA